MANTDRDACLREDILDLLSMEDENVDSVHQTVGLWPEESLDGLRRKERRYSRQEVWDALVELTHERLIEPWVNSPSAYRPAPVADLTGEPDPKYWFRPVSSG